MNISKLQFYKRTIAVVKDLPQLLEDNSRIWTYLQFYSHMNMHEAWNYLQTDAYPLIVPVMNLINRNNKYDIWGNTPPHKTYIEISENLLKDFEEVKPEKDVYDLGFMVAVTLLHELVHYSRNHHNIKEMDGEEPGTAFEIAAFGNYIEVNNASANNHYQKSFKHLKRIIEKDEKITNKAHY